MKEMSTNEMLNAIATNPEAAAMAERMLSKYDRELTFAEVIALVYNQFFKIRKDV
jgi:TusA-related sulfurtransferase